MADIGWGLVAKVWRTMVPPGLLAFGVTGGGGVLGAFGQWLVGQSGANAADLGFRIRIWAVAIAIGGTMTAFENLERGLSQGALPQIVKDILVLGSAYLGAQAAYWWLRALTL